MEKTKMATVRLPVSVIQRIKATATGENLSDWLRRAVEERLERADRRLR